MLSIELDDARTGCGRKFETPLFLREAQRLHVSETLLVSGDAVEDRLARVVELDVDDPRGVFEFLDAPDVEVPAAPTRTVEVPRTR